MKDLIEALQIFLKYDNRDYPIQCEHDAMYITGIDPEEVFKDDKENLEKLGFIVDTENECFVSFRFGSS